MPTTSPTNDDLLIAEEVMLLMLPDDGKTGSALTNARYALTGALLVELAMRDLVEVREEKKTTFVRAASRSAVGYNEPTDRLLADAFTALGNAEQKVSTFVENEFPKIDEVVLDRLVDRGILARETTRSLWVFTTTQWPEKDPRPEAALRSNITDALEGRADPDERTGAIIALLSAAGVLNCLRPPLPWSKDIKKRAAEIQSSNCGSAAVSATVESVTSAVAATMAAVLVATTATTVVTT